MSTNPLKIKSVVLTLLRQERLIPGDDPLQTQTLLNSSPVSKLLKPSTYESAFRSYQRYGLENPEIWKEAPEKGSEFWKKHLDKLPKNASPTQAFEFLVPVYISSKHFPVFTLQKQINWNDNAEIHIQPEGFVYPHAISIGLNFRIKFRKPTDIWPDCITLLHQIGLEKIFVNENNQNSDVLFLLSSLLSAVRKIAWGESFPNGRKFPGKFTAITTFIDGKAGEPIPLLDLRKSIQSLCNWQTNDLSMTNPKDLEQLKLTDQRSHYFENTHGVYGNKTAHHRVVWMPEYFALNKPQRPTLGCYHKNLTMLSTHIQSLIALLQTTTEYKSKGIPTPYHKSLYNNAFNLLEKFYTGDPSVYKSGSALDQIEGQLETIKEFAESTGFSMFAKKELPENETDSEPEEK
ncbi:MAG: hypothetical protein CVU39_21235 [Chloroflexi bacterium HGW-Chloroflexi-10]|nr:MAG: hypothetical protein CVU39_21235 [Chloroflexi bacterium HGW-Chloroflexi-10]